MGEMKHTPGPWAFIPKATRENDSMGFSTFTANVAVGEGDDSHGNMLASVHMGGPGAIHSTRESVEANARLIAAAPDLLEAAEALEAAEDHWANCEECDEMAAECPELGCEKAFELADNARLMRRAAIAKAKGEEIQ